MQPIFKDELTEIYCCDNKNIIKELEYDCVVTDPPYGIKIGKRKWHGNNGKTRIHGHNEWDEFAPEFLHEIIKNKLAIVWGGNNFDNMPSSKGWFVWDKLQSNYGADCELAWNNLNIASKVFRMSRIDAYFNKRIFKKEHPAEKPLQLMEWCIGFLPKVNIVLDSYMGCGSTIIAARNKGIKCIGIEQKREYCDIAIGRIKTYNNENI